MPEKLPTVREHADNLIGKMVEDGTIVSDTDAAVRATGLPSFSAGTTTLDPNTGKPVVPKKQAKAPEFADGVVAPPDQASAGRTAEELLAEHQKRIAAAAAAKDATTQDLPATDTQGQPVTGAAKAEDAAQQMLDAFAEYEEFEVDDADLGMKYPVRVPKQFAKSAKRGYPRQATYDRSVSYLRNAEPVLRQLIEDGRIQQILPLIQRALTDPTYGEFVWNGYERAQRGLPLIEAAAKEAAAAGAALHPDIPPELNLDVDDPFFAERVRPIMQQVETLNQKLARFEEERKTQAQAQAEEQRVQQWRGDQMRLAHMDLARTFPDEYTGNLTRDQALWQRTLQFARDAGYIDSYGFRAGIVFAGQQVHIADEERREATSSPAAAALAAAENKHMELARAQAAAGARAVGTGAAMQSAPSRPIPKPSPRNQDGSLKPPKQFLMESQDWLASQGMEQ